jgi:multidrug efflux pump subunit AcrA (membrane-fusion protein)
MRNVNAALQWILIVLSSFQIGCRQQAATDRSPQPRPVSVVGLTTSDPSRALRVAGSVASWKTEEIGFEVAGRVQFVAEPGTDVAGRIYDEDGNLVSEGTLLASLDERRYQLAVNSVTARINTTQKHQKAVNIEVESVIPAQQQAAEAELEFQKSEYERERPLFERGVTAKAAYDRVVANYRAAFARVSQVSAQREAKAAELASIAEQIEEIQQELADAERDIADCKLYSPYRGQVADVRVIPGAFVERGQPVVTVQMMDPIKVELEVSAETLRRLKYRDNIPLFLSLPDEGEREINSIVYITDPTADPLTRTFTVTLLARNEKTRTPVPKELDGEDVVRTTNLWKILAGMTENPDVRFTEESAIHDDQQGAFVWKITNRHVGMPANKSSSLLNVTKVRVTRGELLVSLLGLAKFRKVTVNDGKEFDEERDLVAGELIFPPGVEGTTWNGDSMLLDEQRWLLRPGDLVGVDITGGNAEPGFFVPLDAVAQATGRFFLYVVASVGASQCAKRIEVNVFETVDTLVRVAPVNAGALKEGMQLIARGTHYLQDGEPILIAETLEAR